MAKRFFCDFDEFADSINGIAGRFVPIARSDTDWWIQTVGLGPISVQLFQIGGAAAFAGDGRSDALTLGIPLCATKQCVRIDGAVLRERTFLLVAENRPFTLTCQRPVQWMTIKIPTDQDLLQPELLASVASYGVSARAETNSADLERLRVTLWHIFASHPNRLLEREAGRLAREEIVSLTSRVLESSSGMSRVCMGRPKVTRERVLARALELIRESEGQPLFTSDLCRAAEVSERTLRRTFEEYFGVGPMRLLRLRQLREIRAALLGADPACETVASIAGRFGVWDFSLFARNYRKLYGEAPSATLRRGQPDRDCHSAVTSTWIGYACRKFAIAVGALEDDECGGPESIRRRQRASVG